MAAAANETEIFGPKPTWLTFDCYGTLIQWDEGLAQAVGRICARHGLPDFDTEALIARYDAHEHALEGLKPHRRFRAVAGEALRQAMAECGLICGPADVEILTNSISAMPPFPEVPGALARLKAGGFKTCIISNTDDAIIAGNVAQLGPGAIDRVITAEQAGAYKPSRVIFETAWAELEVERADVVHICASPHLDHAAARDLSFRCIWIDRGTGRDLLPDYTPDMTLPTLDRVPAYFDWLGWMGR
jgi:2-haloacid dehalogenase